MEHTTTRAEEAAKVPQSKYNVFQCCTVVVQGTGMDCMCTLTQSVYNFSSTYNVHVHDVVQAYCYVYTRLNKLVEH